LVDELLPRRIEADDRPVVREVGAPPLREALRARGPRVRAPDQLGDRRLLTVGQRSTPAVGLIAGGEVVAGLWCRGRGRGRGRRGGRLRRLRGRRGRRGGGRRR